MICPKCGANNIADAAFCASCGVPLNTAGTAKGRHAGDKRLPAGLKVLIAVLSAAVVAAVAIAVALSSAPPALTDEAVLEALPEGAEILARHEQDRGRTQLIEYTYPERHAYCSVMNTERRSFRYGKGVWAAEDGAELLARTENWAALAGIWTETAFGPDGRYLCLEVGGFSEGGLTGRIVYSDPASSCEGPAESYFSTGVKTAGAYLLEGIGYFQHTYLRIDPDRGVFFGNDRAPMEKTERTEGPPAALTGRHDPGREAETPEGTARTWLIAVAELNVRPAPGTDSEPLGTVGVGAVLPYTGWQDGWYLVEYEGGVGYVAGEYVREVPADGFAGVVTAMTDLNVRAGPGTDRELLGTVENGARLVYTGLESGWYQVVYDGNAGYVSANYVTASPAEFPET